MRLVYGQVETPEDLDTIAAIADECGVDPWDLIPATGEPADEPPASTNPYAVYDPDVRIYSESTAPEGPNRVAAHHSSDTGEQTGNDEDDAEALEAFTAAVYSDLHTLLDYTPAEGTADLDAELHVATWTSARHARSELHTLLLAHPRTRYRAHQYGLGYEQPRHRPRPAGTLWSSPTIFPERSSS